MSFTLNLFTLNLFTLNLFIFSRPLGLLIRTWLQWRRTGRGGSVASRGRPGIPE